MCEASRLPEKLTNEARADLGRQGTADTIRTHTTITQTGSDTKTRDEILVLLTTIADYHPSAFPVTSHGLASRQ